MSDEPQKKQEKEEIASPSAEPAPDDKLKKCEAERQEYLDGWKRARADFINFQKDEAKRFEAFAKFASADVIEELILVLDSFDLAIAGSTRSPHAEHAKTDGDTKGMFMVRSQLEDILKKRGLAAIQVTPG